MTEVKLVRYEAARKALAEARRVDEVKSIRDKAVAMQVYAKQAKDRSLIDNATDIRVRAERKAGEMLRHMTIFGERAVPGDKESGRGKRPLSKPTLGSLGISKQQSSRWQKLASVSNHQFERSLSEMKDQAVKSLDRTQVQSGKKQQRAKRERELAKNVVAMPGKNYGVIYADPPWRFEPYSRETGMDRAADNHYPTMDVQALMQMSVPTAKSCVLFLWATVPMLPEALAVLSAWRFEYKSHFVWDKGKAGTGYWNRNRHELLLIGTIGNVPAPDESMRVHSLLGASRGKHSEKPVVFRKLIEKMFPTVRKLELFGREQVKGWDVFGNEVKEAAE